MISNIRPSGSRYIPLTQQPYLCVPTCIQMIMYKNNIPLIPAEQIGYELGLTVPPDYAKYFYKVRTSDTPPVTSGYGTQIQTPDYEPNKAFGKLNIPLSFSIKLSSSIESVDSLMAELICIEQGDTDALLCFNPGVLYRGAYQPNTGHVVVFDRIIGKKVRVIDPDAKLVKWKYVEPTILFDAMSQHGDQNSGGIWYFNKTISS